MARGGAPPPAAAWAWLPPGDEASLAAHFKHPNYLNMRDALGRIGLKGADNKKYRVDLSEPVYDSTFTPRADFFTEGTK